MNNRTPDPDATNKQTEQIRNESPFLSHTRTSVGSMISHEPKSDGWFVSDRVKNLNFKFKPANQLVKADLLARLQLGNNDVKPGLPPIVKALIDSPNLESFLKARAAHAQVENLSRIKDMLRAQGFDLHEPLLHAEEREKFFKAWADAKQRINADVHSVGLPTKEEMDLEGTYAFSIRLPDNEETEKHQSELEKRVAEYKAARKLAEKDQTKMETGAAPSKPKYRSSAIPLHAFPKYESCPLMGAASYMKED